MIMKPPIHSQKHIIQYPFDQIGTGTHQAIDLAIAVQSTVANLANEVAEGSVIKACFIELWLQNSANDGEQIVTVCKDGKDGVGPNFAQMAALFTYNNKKNILFTHQGLSSNDGVGNPQFVIRQWVKIPKGKQRFGLGDKLILSIANVSSNNLNRCGMSIYKEYS